MAIQVSGTNVITNARALNNITSIDSTTAAAIGAGGIGGKLLQVVSSKSNTRYYSNSASNGTWVSTGHNISITPTSSSSKIFVSFTGGDSYSPYGSTNRLAIFRGSTKIIGSTSDYGGMYTTPEYVYGQVRSPLALTVLDSPATTSQVTYSLRSYVHAGNSYVNDTGSNGTQITMTCMEIGS